MDSLEKTLYYNELLLIYKNLLTDKQIEILNDYFVMNLSISEISNERNISRAGVDDALQKACSKLDYFEENLHLYQKNKTIISKLEQLKNLALNQTEIDEINSIEGDLKDGI